MDFLSNNLVLVLGILGAALALVASLSKTVQEKPSRRMLVALTVLGFVTLVAQQLIKAGLDAQSARQRKLAEVQREQAEQDRDRILAAISGTVQTTAGTVEHTAGVVDEISRRLAGASLRDVGTSLVSVDANASEAQTILSYGKGPVSAWDGYARWIDASRDAPGRTFLSFEVNASRSYVAGLTLAYLLTAPATEDRLRPIVESGARGTWFDAPWVARFLLEGNGVDYVLFRDGASQRVVAYAPARAFAGELLHHLRAGDVSRAEDALNRRQSDPARSLVQLFPSVRASVLEETEVAEVVRTMLDRKWPECVSGGNEGRFLVSLENAVRVAEAGGPG